MDSNQINLHQDQYNLQFYDYKFIQEFGQLKRDNVLDYFMLSYFYDRTSINQQCIDQKLNFSLFHEKKIGIEYIVEETVNKDENPIYIIKKYYRTSEKQRTLLSLYYVFNDIIYQSPDIYRVISSNIQTVSDNFLEILNILNEENEKNDEN